MPSARRSFVVAVVLLLAVAGLGQLPVVWADPPDDPQAYVDSFPADPPFTAGLQITPTPAPDDLWNLRKIGLPCAAPYDDLMDVVDDNVIVAVVDTGVDPTHPLLAGRLVPGYDFVNHDSDPADDQGHGTHTAGTVALVAPPVKIMPLKALGSTGAGAHSWIANAIVWATDHGADVINLGLGGPYTSATMQHAVEYAWSKGVVLAAAVGSGGTSNPTYPAAYPEVMGVTSITREDKRASFSNYGDYVSVAAPGVSILSSVRGGSYQAWSGTSMGVPHVSALAGLVKAFYPPLTNRQIREAIERGADDLGAPGWDPLFGYGRIHVCQTLQIAQSMMLYPISPTVIPRWTPTPPVD